MSNLLTHREWTRQPPYAAAINYGNPLSIGLVSCVLQSIGSRRWLIDAVKPSRVLNIANSAEETFAPANYGVAVDLQVEGAYFLTSDIPWNPKNGCTILCRYRPLVIPSDSNTIVGFGSDSTTPIIQIGHVPSTGHIQWYFRDNAGATMNITSSQVMPAGQWTTFCVWTNGTNDHGIRVSNTSYTNTTSLGAFTAPTSYALMALYRASAAANASTGALLGPWMWNRILSTKEMDEMNANPWQVFLPQKRILPAFNVGSGVTASPFQYYAQQ